MMNIFIERLKDLIQEKKITQTQLAREINTTQQAISRYLKNERTPDIQTLTKICRFFQVSADFLLGLEDEFGSKNYIEKPVQVEAQYIYGFGRQGSFIKIESKNLEKDADELKKIAKNKPPEVAR